MKSALKPANSAVQVADRRWIVLAVIALAQLMVALDATIVSIALPWAQRTVGASDVDRQWVITAYTLAFGSLLLAGGRVADTLGRKRTFLIGLAGFAVASAAGGAAVTFPILLVARAAQGAFAALLAPTALSLLSVTFGEPRERARAFAVYGAIAGSGAALGLLLGGILTQAISWRWCLFVNVFFAVLAAAGGARVLPRDGRAPRPRLDLLGIVLGSGGLVALVYGCTRAVSDGWSSGTVIGLLLASGILLVAFVGHELRTPRPLLPLRIILDRNRGGANLAVIFAVAGMFGAFLFLTYYLQVVLRYPPLIAGLAFLPIPLASQAASWGIASVFMPRLRARSIMAPGALLAAAGLLVLTQLQAGGGYLAHVLPAELLLGAGISCVMAPAFNVGTQGVDPRQAGVAAAAVNAAGQVGASLGTALLNTIAASATAAALAAPHPSAAVVAHALVRGYATASGWAAAILVVGAIVVFLLIDAGPPQRRIV
jgi:EmrB/QacA subfamily drug resistance transporter